MRAITIVILIAIMLVQLSAVRAESTVPLPTQQIGGCDSLLKLTAPKEILLSKENETIIQAEVLNVRCSASHVYIDIENIRPDIYFTLNPDFYQSILPGKNASFNMTFPPGKALNKTEYTGTYWIRTNNKWFNSGEVKIKVRGSDIRGTGAQNGKKEIPQEITPAIKMPETKSQLAVFAFALLIGIFGGAYYYFKGEDKGEKHVAKEGSKV